MMYKNVEKLERIIREYDGSAVKLMEVCGTHTQQIAHFGMHALLSEKLSLLSGPGCPVCVTPAEYIDCAAEIAVRPGHTILSFGDMMRVPGRGASLLEAKASGGSISLMYSPMEVLKHAKSEPKRTFFVAAVGFETTLPLYALLTKKLRAENIKNVRLMMSVKALLPGIEWICENNSGINAFIGPGNVSAVTGYGCYEYICNKYKLPMAVAGFGYEHLLAAIVDLIGQNGRNTHEVHNYYPSVVSREGNVRAIELIGSCFKKVDSVWRGFGTIEKSAYRLTDEFAEYDAGAKFDIDADEPPGCLCAEIITGKSMPVECSLFGNLCTPENPIGPCMVSGEGACGIWHFNGRKR